MCAEPGFAPVVHLMMYTVASRGRGGEENAGEGHAVPERLPDFPFTVVYLCFETLYG